eukprot:TRINITY_DN11127_c0_g1_i1.p1 TRINITY_DN11127_c0_g1~~TRINITY_DN11127_c0_g1_i1.p1  ORF type:complete len:234 (-),score=63.50 TRINITY_DN11127_c0_g1_i1:140-841(-)
MGGKGRRRRERNYLKAHGGYEPLAPPPSAKDVDAIPAKLRLLIDLKKSVASQKQKNATKSVDATQASQSITNEAKPQKAPKVFEEIRKRSKDANATSQDVKEVEKGPSNKKRKRDLDELHHLIEGENLSSRSRKHERRKKFLENKKKKQRKKSADDDTDFPRYERIKFGEVVTAPPKLELPKKFLKEPKTRQDISQERLRLQAIGNYRNRRGWVSRPGSYVPPSNAFGNLSTS